MNNVFKKLRSKHDRGKNLVISIVILFEIIAILTVAAFAWVETISSIKIKTDDPGTVNTYVYTDVNINDTNSSIDLAHYFKQSGDMHLTPASSANGSTFYFPKTSISPTSGKYKYREGDSSDKNTAYMSVSFRIHVNQKTDFYFNGVPSFGSFNDDIRVSVIARDEDSGSPDQGSDNIYARTAASNVSVVNDVNGNTTTKNIYSFDDYTKTHTKLFRCEQNKVKIVTINLWLQKKSGSDTDLTAVSNMAENFNITDFGITSQYTPRRFTLLPTPTWDFGGACYYAWCWNPGESPSHLYKLSLNQEDEHYTFNYNGSYSNTLFVRAVQGCTVAEGDYASWPFTNDTANNTKGCLKQTVDTTIPDASVTENPTYVIQTYSGGTNSKSTGDWPLNGTGTVATVKFGYVNGQNSNWGTMTATSYTDTSTSDSKKMEESNPNSQKHQDTIHAWPGKKLKLTATAKSGYRFVGWFDNPEGTGTALSTDGTGFITDAPATATEVNYYAKFIETSEFSVTANARYRDFGSSTYYSGAAGGSVQVGDANSGATSYEDVKYKGYVNLVATPESGYRFVGWRWASDESSDMSSEMEVTESLQVYSDMTFHAHWEAINYRVEWYFLNCANQSEVADFRRDFAGYNPSLTLPETRNLAERDSIIDDIILANREWTALLDALTLADTGYMGGRWRDGRSSSRILIWKMGLTPSDAIGKRRYTT